MTSLVAVASYLPSSSVALSTVLRWHGMEKTAIRTYVRYSGFSRVPMDPSTTLSDHLVAAALALDEFDACRPRVRYVVQARTMPVVAPYPDNPLHDVCRRLGLEHAEAFCLTQHACAGGLLALDVAGDLLEADGDPDALALVIAGEKTFTTNARIVSDTGVMGEATAAVLVSAYGTRDRMLGYSAHTDGRFHRSVWAEPGATATFQDEYPSLLSDVIRAAVGEAGLTMDDIALVLPHNVNRLSWIRVLRVLGIRGRDRLYLDNLSTHAHCYCADAFINYRSAVDTGRLRSGDKYLMTAVGLGATFSAMVLEH